MSSGIMFYPGAVRLVVDTPRALRLRTALVTIAELEEIHFGSDPKGVATLLPDLAAQFAPPKKPTNKTPSPKVYYTNPYYDGTTGTVDWDRAEHAHTGRTHKHLRAADARTKSKRGH